MYKVPSAVLKPSKGATTGWAKPSGLGKKSSPQYEWREIGDSIRFAVTASIEVSTRCPVTAKSLLIIMSSRS